MSAPIPPVPRPSTYNNGSFEQRARLFGGFWQNLSKSERASRLTIDSEDV